MLGALSSVVLSQSMGYFTKKAYLENLKQGRRIDDFAIETAAYSRASWGLKSMAADREIEE